MKMFDLAWYLEWEEGEGAPTWGKMWVFIDTPRLCSLFNVRAVLTNSNFPQVARAVRFLLFNPTRLLSKVLM